MTEQLVTYLNDYLGFTINDAQLIDDFFIIENKGKKDFLIKENTLSTDFHFILTGYVRTFHTTKEGEEITTEILRKGEIASSMYSLLKNQPSFENIQCISDCTICRISEKSFEELCSINPQWFQLGMKFLKNDILSKEERIRDFAKLKANDRYLKLLNEKPDIIQNVPVLYIASYIGVKPESLSRIRSQEAIS
jgi:CRP-like cAMP-binding protein